MAEDGIWGSIPDIAVAVTAVVALVQPYIFFGYRRLFIKPVLSIEETAFIDLNAYDRGPLIGLRGGLLTQYKDVFVRQIHVRLIKLDNKAETILEWHAALRNTVTYDATTGKRKDEVAADLPYPFVVKQNEAAQYNFLFCHLASRERARQIFSEIMASWTQDFGSFLSKAGLHSKDRDEIHSTAHEFFERVFSHSDVFTRAQRTLEKDFLWLSGRYNFEINVHASTGQIFSKGWAFSVTEAQEIQLRGNMKQALYAACGIATTIPQQVWVPYELQ